MPTKKEATAEEAVKEQKATPTKTVTKAPAEEPKDQASKDAKTADKEVKKTVRLSNAEFFSKDILGNSQRTRLIRPVEFNTRTGKALYRLVYERMDTYLYRPKEIAGLHLARDVNEQIIKIIDNRLTELENFVEKRYKKVKGLYTAAMSIERYDTDNGGALELQIGFSTSYANRLLTVLQKIDVSCAMASYLEMVGQFTIQQENYLASEMYRKTVQINRSLMVFIGRAIIGVRKSLAEQRKAS